MHALPPRLLIAFMCLSLAGCASSKFVNQWACWKPGASHSRTRGVVPFPGLTSPPKTTARQN